MGTFLKEPFNRFGDSELLNRIYFVTDSELEL